MENVEAVISEWERYFALRIRRGSTRAESYLAYVARLLSADLPPILSFDHLSRLTGIDPVILAGFIASTEDFYRTFDVPKRRGGVREIEVPTPALLQVQRWILDNILSQVGVHAACHGFYKGKSIITNAAAHLGSKAMLKMDLADFFPSISLRRGLSVFMRLGYPPNVSYYLSALCFRNGKLPQGAATSPALSNIVSKRMDTRLAGAANKLGLIYTRYADDLFFSGEDINHDLLGLATGIIAAEGFSVNVSKTKFIKDNEKKIVTGISISSGALKLPRPLVRNLKKQVHFILRRGYWNHIAVTGDRDPILLERLLGRLSFWLQIEPENPTARTLHKRLLEYSRAN